MRIDTWLAKAQKQLDAAGIGSARLDCLLLLEDSLGLDRARLLAHPEAEIPTKTEVGLNKKIAQRSSHTPLAYVRGHAPFYGREFLVNPHVLVPRPETEEIINLARKLNLPVHSNIVDVGTGSGCIGITLALELPESKVWMYDVDEKALAIARANAKRLGVQAIIRQRHLLPPEPQRIDLLVANLPYVPTSLTINKAAHFEPKIALFSGLDGLDLYREFWQQLATRKPNHVITEALPSQHAGLEVLAEKAGYELVDSAGFAQHFSLSGQRPV